MTLTGLTAILVRKSVLLSVAVVIAGAILNEAGERHDAEGVDITINYVYGVTNDGVLGWNTSLWDLELFY